MKPRSHRKGRALSQLLYALSLGFLAFGLFSLGWVAWPPPTDARQFRIPAGPLPAAPEDMAYASFSEYSLEVSWPRWLRRGEEGAVHLRLTDLDCNASCEDSTASSKDHEPRPADEFQGAQVVLVEPALYPLRVDPPGSAQANLADEQDLLLAWQVTGDQSGSFPGKMVVSFGFYDETFEELVPIPVAVVDLNIQVVDLWGLDSGLVIWFGFVGVVLWGVLFVLGRVAAGER